MSTTEKGRNAGLNTFSNKKLLDLLLHEVSDETVSLILNSVTALVLHRGGDGGPSAAGLLNNNHAAVMKAVTDALTRANRPIPEFSLGIVKGGGQTAPAGEAAPEPVKPKFSETDLAILRLGAKTGVRYDGAPKTVGPSMLTLDADDMAQMNRLADEAVAEQKALAASVYAACRSADEALAILTTKKGEALLTDAVTVEAHPESKVRWILFRSSTAPWLGDSGPNVKHDFLANEKPVNVNHPDMFRQVDGQRVIRSKVITKNTHEFYVKALKYQDGMLIKGYVCVGGTTKDHESEDLTRYYQCQGMKIVRISKDEYNSVARNIAAGYDPLTGQPKK